MAKKPPVERYELLAGKIDDLDKYVHQTYDKQIDWYWRICSYNKKNYKMYQYLTIILGALVTLIASLSTTEIIANDAFWSKVFLIATPVLAATLTIFNSLSQNFQWGATWRDMSVSATRLQKEKNRFLATDAKERNHRKELILINDIIMEETQSFFRRILDTETVPIDSPNDKSPTPDG